MSGWGWAVTTVSSLLVLGLLALVAWAVVRAVRRPGDGYSWPTPTAGQEETAERLLADRFARGQIDEDEYRRRLATLRELDAGIPPR